MTEYKESVFTKSLLVKRSVDPQDYQAYLDSDEWKIKSAAKKAENPRCSLCNRMSKVLHVHHRTYKRLGSENSFDLTVLCENCHDLFHRNYQYDSKLGCFYTKRKGNEMKRSRKSKKKIRNFDWRKYSSRTK